MKLKTSHIRGSLILINLLVFVACVPVYYAPNAHNVPLFSEKNEATVSASYATMENPGPMVGADLQLAIAVSDHVGIMANGLFTSSLFLYENGADRFDAECKGQFFEAGGGYYRALEDNPRSDIIFETYGGIGFGKYTNNSNDEIWPSSASFQRFFLQPSIGFKSRYFEAVVSFRVAGLNYSNYTIRSGIYGPMDRFSLLLEPALTLRVGIKHVKLQYQIGLSENLNNPSLLQSKLYVGFGIIARIPGTSSRSVTSQAKVQ